MSVRPCSHLKARPIFISHSFLWDGVSWSNSPLLTNHLWFCFPHLPQLFSLLLAIQIYLSLAILGALRQFSLLCQKKPSPVAKRGWPSLRLVIHIQHLWVLSTLVLLVLLEGHSHLLNKTVQNNCKVTHWKSSGKYCRPPGLTAKHLTNADFA